MNYQRMTKAQLIERIETLESSSLNSRLQQIRSETQLLRDDLIKMTRYLFEAGVASRKSLEQLKNARILRAT